MRQKKRGVLGRRKWSSSKGVVGFSERSGTPGKYSKMVVEPGTGFWVHRKESDGVWNITEAFRDFQVAPEPQRLEHPGNVPAGALTAVTQLDLGFEEEVEED